PPPQPRMPGRARMEMAAAAPAAADVMMAKAVDEERQQYAAEEAVATVQDSGTAVSFAVPGSTDIPSDGSPHKTTINRFRLQPRLDYLAVPKHTDAVFRRITVNNDSPSP